MEFEVGERLIVFCIADVPTITINRLLHCIEEDLKKGDVYDMNPDEGLDDTSNSVYIIDTKDITTAMEDTPFPVTSSPTAFLGHTLKEVHDWFNSNIDQTDIEGFMRSCFLILDERSAEDDSCIFVSTLDEEPGEIHSLRCEFDIAMQTAISCIFGMEPLEEGMTGCFMRSGSTMTKESVELDMNGGTYTEDGEVKVNQEWRDFMATWSV